MPNGLEFADISDDTNHNYVDIMGGAPNDDISFFLLILFLIMLLDFYATKSSPINLSNIFPKTRPP